MAYKGVVTIEARVVVRCHPRESTMSYLQRLDGLPLRDINLHPALCWIYSEVERK